MRKKLPSLSKNIIVRRLTVCFELPHPTCVGWGFYGLMPVKPRLVQLRVYLTKLETIHPKISGNSSLSVWCPGEPVRPYTCHVTRLACARGFLWQEIFFEASIRDFHQCTSCKGKLFVVRTPGKLISYDILMILRARFAYTRYCCASYDSILWIHKLTVTSRPLLHLCGYGL